VWLQYADRGLPRAAPRVLSPLARARAWAAGQRVRNRARVADARRAVSRHRPGAHARAAPGIGWHHLHNRTSRRSATATRSSIWHANGAPTRSHRPRAAIRWTAPLQRPAKPLLDVGPMGAGMTTARPTRVRNRHPDVDTALYKSREHADYEAGSADRAPQVWLALADGSRGRSPASAQPAIHRRARTARRGLVRWREGTRSDDRCATWA